MPESETYLTWQYQHENNIAQNPVAPIKEEAKTKRLILVFSKPEDKNMRQIYGLFQLC